MISATQAKAEGYTIDNHAAGRPVAYKGNRFAPTEFVPVLTDEEEQLLAALEPLANMILHVQRHVGVYEAYALHVGADVAKQIVAAVAAARGVQ